MSTDCENLLKKLLVLNPAKRQELASVMQDRWINIGFEDNELQPYAEPAPDYSDPVRIEIMVRMGYSRDGVRESVRTKQYDEIMATYLLLGRAKVSKNCVVANPALALFLAGNGKHLPLLCKWLSLPY
jgi:MAP/microtubule affinity-regulating kinase